MTTTVKPCQLESMQAYNLIPDPWELAEYQNEVKLCAECGEEVFDPEYDYCPECWFALEGGK